MLAIDEIPREVHANRGTTVRSARRVVKKNRDKNPFLFADEVGRAIDFLEINPAGGVVVRSPVDPHFRRISLNRSRNELYYWNEPGTDVVWIVCFWGGPKRRKPQLTLREIP